MFYIVESDEQLNYLCALGRNEAYVEIISGNDRYHSLLTGTVAAYVRPIGHS